MNVNQDNTRNFRDNFTRQSRLSRLNPLGENLFLPYKTGEHYMQNIGYLALADATKLYDSRGNEVNLYDAYEIKN